MQNRFSFANIPPVVKNLLIINVLGLLAVQAFYHAFKLDITNHLALYLFNSPNFKPYQIVTSMFMHGNFPHLLSNMFALFIFGVSLERVWGARRFLIYYFVTGLGAATLHWFASYIEFASFASSVSPSALDEVMRNGADLLNNNKNYVDGTLAQLNVLLNTPALGASGAVFGILLAFGMMYPNQYIILMFPPIPIKAKYFVMIYGGMELYLGFSQPNSGIAHFAHLGGMLFGFLLMKYWRNNSKY